MRANLDVWVENWFNSLGTEQKEIVLENYRTCADWLKNYVENFWDIVFLDFFDADEYMENDEEQKKQALAWIEENANEIVDFDILKL